jgi:methionyl-tRNA formyltransferase
VTTSLRLALAGTPELAATVLTALIECSPHRITRVYTQPDRPAGRGRKLTMSPVKIVAMKYGLPVSEPSKPSEIDPEHHLAGVDALIVVAYGMLLPPGLLKRPRYGCINVHTSLLPRWRGAAPIQRAIQAGDTETGVTIMQMDASLDTGPILAQMKCPVVPDETAASLGEKLSELGKTSLLETLDAITTGHLQPVPQDEELACYANKITKAEAELDWSQPAAVLERTVRAFNPAPVARTSLNGYRLRVWKARSIESADKSAPGRVIKADSIGIDVATGAGLLRLLVVQPPGGRQLSASEFLNGRPDFLHAQDTAS